MGVDSFRVSPPNKSLILKGEEEGVGGGGGLVGLKCNILSQQNAGEAYGANRLQRPSKNCRFQFRSKYDETKSFIQVRISNIIDKEFFLLEKLVFSGQRWFCKLCATVHTGWVNVWYHKLSPSSSSSSSSAWSTSFYMHTAQLPSSSSSSTVCKGGVVSFIVIFNIIVVIVVIFCHNNTILIDLRKIARFTCLSTNQRCLFQILPRQVNDQTIWRSTSLQTTKVWDLLHPSLAKIDTTHHHFKCPWCHYESPKLPIVTKNMIFQTGFPIFLHLEAAELEQRSNIQLCLRVFQNVQKSKDLRGWLAKYVVIHN